MIAEHFYLRGKELLAMKGLLSYRRVKFVCTWQSSRHMESVVYGGVFAVAILKESIKIEAFPQNFPVCCCSCFSIDITYRHCI
jgi:hypothetical protein